ncbi:TerB family tellurite resistance protein [Gammaproteobacteria bacterium]|nr:TerB family tellurite resistance protein [Gammaproteobacteria bacterium]
MFKNLFNKKKSFKTADAYEVDVALRLMFEIAISDGTLDESELKLIKKRADKIAKEDEKTSSIIKKIIDETEDSVSLYPTIKKINDFYTFEEKVELMSILWELIAADSIINPYEENLYFKIAELIKIKRSKANQIKQEHS